MRRRRRFLSLTRYSQAKACEREVTFPTTSEQAESLLNRGLSTLAAALASKEPSCIIYLTAQKRPLDWFDFGAGEDRAM